MYQGSPSKRASEVMEAVRMYDSVKNMFFMPVSLKMVCDTFFEGLVVQLDFHQEFANGKLFKELAHGGTDGTNNLLIIPRMLDVSDECLVMEYEPSQSIVLSERNKIDKHTLLRACYCMSVFGNLNWTIEMMHLDPHFGNFGIRDDKLVIYDFGLMVDIRKTNFNSMLKSKYLYDIDILIKY
jgi:predicted unusual protein kinase regulating ubiquinone biosynthesis (AarF/ABC1/UbiB family)